jgi:GntR family transcriptional regulator, transcriptional repressor for pyruvate dehydrogenase complex
MEREVLRTGDRLPSERELAKQFGVSRVTVRQALSVLQAMGLIESRIGNRTFARAGHKALSVTDLASALRVAQENLTEQLELRRLIEPQVACLAAERATDADLDDLLRYISLQEARLSQGVPFVEEDGAFHLAIAQATKNSLLVKMVEGIQELLQESHEHSMRASGGRDSRRWLMLRSRSQPDEPSGPWQPVWPICRSWLCRRRVRAA